MTTMGPLLFIFKQINKINLVIFISNSGLVFSHGAVTGFSTLFSLVNQSAASIKGLVIR